MDLTVRVVCRPELAPGFELAGVAADAAADPATANATVRRLASDPEVGVILVEERLRRTLPSDLVQRLDRVAFPILVPFPSPSWTARGQAEEYVLEILRQAVGYRVRPK